MIFEARDLTVRYAGAPGPALDRANLRVEAGELVALVGPNGCGKTTMLRALLGIVEPASGQALVQGRAPTDWPRAALARFVGVVAQREETWLPLTVEETVLLGRYPRLGALAPVSGEDRVQVRHALERCDVWSLRDRVVETLSGGEWQRVRIARALAQQPSALVLDEPATALDVRHEMEVMELVAQLVREGLACLLITHHLNLAARYAHRMVLLDAGRVVAAGPPAVVMRPEVLSPVFRWPVEVTAWEGAPQLVPLKSGDRGMV